MHLYDFTFEIPGSDALSDHFGFVDFKIEGRSFVLKNINAQYAIEIQRPGGYKLIEY